MRCLQCHQDGVPITAEICPNPECAVYLPSLLKDVLPPGTVLAGGRYRIDYALGRGGFGITYRAMHIGLEQAVAIKEFYPTEHAHREGASLSVRVSRDRQEKYERGLQRFLREGRVLTRLDHPNVIRVRDLFEEHGTAYLVMDLVSGASLRRELDAQPGRRLAPERVRAVMDGLVAALAAVHAESVYHLDVKPDNILLAPSGQILLIDFGAAKQGLGDGGSTQEFTVEYAAPEVLAGGGLGPESDVFSAGMVLHELLTGTRPPTAVSRMIRDDWRPGDVAEPWRSLLRAALQLQRARRPADIRAWWGGAAGKQRIVPPDPPPPGNRRWLLGGIAGVAVLGAVIAWSQCRGPDPGPDPDLVQNQTASPSPSPSGSRSPSPSPSGSAGPSTPPPSLPPVTPTGRVVAPVVVPADKPLVLASDPLSDPARGILPKAGPASELGKYQLGYRGGKYEVEKQDAAFNQLPAVYLPGEYRDTTLKVDAEIAEEARGRYLAFSCRLSDAGQYRLLIRPDAQNFDLLRRDGTTWTALIGAREARSLRPGTATNTIEFTCSGSTIAVTINGTRAGWVQDAAHSAGSLSMGVSADPGSPPGKILSRFSNLAVTSTVRALDDFTTVSGVVLPTTPGDPKQSSVSVAQGEFLLKKVDVLWDGWPVYAATGEYGDAAIRVDARLTQNVAGGFVALYCRRSGTPAKQYRLQVFPGSRSVVLSRSDGTNTQELSRQRDVQAIKANVLEKNRIELSCAGSTISVSINGTTVYSQADTGSSLVRGQFSIGTGIELVNSTGTVEAAFDEVAVLAVPPP